MFFLAPYPPKNKQNKNKQTNKTKQTNKQIKKKERFNADVAIEHPEYKNPAITTKLVKAFYLFVTFVDRFIQRPNLSY